MPVDSHPLSPAEAPLTSRNARQRVPRGSETEPIRPVTSYFALKSQSDERANSAAYVSSETGEDAITPNATVKPNPRRPRFNPFGSSFRAPSKSPERRSITEPSAPRISITNGREDHASYSKLSSPHIKTPGMTPRAHSTAVKPLLPNVLPGPAAAIALSTQWHNITEKEMDITISKINDSLPAPESHQQIYRSTLRLLSSQLESLDALQAQVELNKKTETIRRRKIASMMEILPPSEVATLRAVLEILSQENFEESPVAGPQLVVSDSLTEAIAEALTPLGIPPPTNSPNTMAMKHDDAVSFMSSVRGTDGDTLESASVRSRSSRKSRDTKNRPTSVIEEWMGGWWRDKNRSISSMHDADSDDDRSHSLGAGGETEVDTKTTRKPSSGGLRMFNSLGVPTSWMGGTTPPSGSSVTESQEQRRPPKRKLSVTISAYAASVGSLTVGHFQPIPSPLPPPSIAQQIPTPPELSPAASTRISTLPPESIPPLPSGPHPSHIKAISYATRVMRSDPNSILQDGGLNVSPLVAELAYTLVCNMKADKTFSLREGGRTEAKMVTPQSPATVFTPEISNPALAVAQMEPTESRATIVSNLSRTLNNSMVAGASAGRRTASIAIAGPLLFAFKPRVMTQNDHGTKPTPSASVAVVQNGPQQLNVVNEVAPKTGTVELDSIIPAEARPPTQYLSRTYTSYIADPTFRPAAFPSAPSRFSVKTDGSTRSLETQTDRFGFIYDASVYDVNLLARAREVSNTAPACLTGVKISDREAETEDEDWWPSHEGELPPSKAKQLKFSPEPCPCQEGLFPIATSGQAAEGSKVDEEPVDELKLDSKSTAEDAAVDSQASTEGPPKTPVVGVPNEVGSLGQESKTKVPNHVCFTTVRVLLLELKSIHDKKQKAQQAEWDPLLRRVRRVKESTSKQPGGTQTVLSQASSGAAIFLGLSKPTEDKEPGDEEASWTTGLGLAHISTNKEEWKEFSRLIRAGIPLVYRSKVWFECSGATELSEPGVFRDLALEARQIDEAVKRGEKRHVAMEEIEKDVTRTMPLNIFFGGDGQGVDKLRAVLGAYSLRNPAVGYCQGMNLVASTLLLVLADQQEAFWVFSAIIERILPPDFFSPSLLVSRACPMVLLDYVQDYLPKLFAHLAAIGIDLPAVCFSWFLSLFTDCLPVETLFRVWDMFLCDKNGMDVLFRVSLAILKTGEDDLLRCSTMSSLYSVLESLPTRMWNADQLLKSEADLRSIVVHDDILKRRAIHVEALSQRS